MMALKNVYLKEIIRTGLFFATLFICLQGKGQQEYDFNMPITQPSPFSIEMIDTINLTSIFGNNAYNDRQVVYPKRELRCAWIATVSNIDYPTSTGQSVSSLKSGFITLMNKLQTAGI